MKLLIKPIKIFQGILFVMPFLLFSQVEDLNKRIIRMQIYTQNSFDQQSTSSDAIRIEFTNDGYNGIDNRDVVKMQNLDENLARQHGGTFLTIENREQPIDGETLNLYIDQYSTTNYVFKFDNENFEDFKVKLRDNYLIQTIDLDDDSLYSFSVNTSINASMAFNRFQLILQEETMHTSSFQSPYFSMTPNPIVQNFVNIESPFFANTKATVSVFNQVGKLVTERKLNFPSNGKITLNNLDFNTGVYLVKIHNQSHHVTKKLVKR